MHPLSSPPRGYPRSASIVASIRESTTVSEQIKWTIVIVTTINVVVKEEEKEEEKKKEDKEKETQQREC